MPRQGRFWILSVPALLLVAFAFHLAADSGTRLLRRRFRPKAVVISGDWSAPALRRGRAGAVESRTARPRLALPIPKADAFLLRIFYVLEGSAPARVTIAGRPAGALAPGPGWRKAVLRTPAAVPAGKLAVAFEVPAGGRLILRRIGYRNYLFRLGQILLLKPAGAARTPYRGGTLAAALAALLALWAALSLRAGRGGRRGPAPRAILSAGAFGLLLILHQAASPYSVHVRPVFLAALFAAITLGAAAAGRRAPGSGRLRLKRAGLVLGGLAAALAIAEGALRLWDPPISRPRIRSHARYSPAYGWTNRPGARGWQVDAGYHIRINRHGHRGPEYPAEKRPGVFRILGLGDSFTFGWGVEEEQTFLRLLERRLRAAGHEVETLNAGVSGWHSVHSLAYLQRDGVRFRPDLIVMTFFVDDVYFKTLDSLRGSQLAIDMREEEELIARYRGGFARRWKLYNVWFNHRRLRRAVAKQRALNPFPSLEEERKALKRDFDKKPERVAGLARMIGRWEKVRDRLGIPVIFAYIPPGGSLGAPALQGEARAMRRLSRAARFPYLDVLSLFERVPDPRTLYLHPRDWHMSAAGHALVADALTRMALEGGWLKQKGKHAP
ncbi:MAG: SGNH/GDSL hydrolase family protein [bacterium]